MIMSHKNYVYLNTRKVLLASINPLAFSIFVVWDMNYFPRLLS